MHRTIRSTTLALAFAAAVSAGVTLSGGCQNKDQPSDSTRHSDGTRHKPGDMHPDHGRQDGAGGPTTRP